MRELDSPGGPRRHPVVSRLGRVLDATGALLFLAGGGVLVRAWLGFRGVSGYHPRPEDGAWAAVQLADRYWLMQKVGATVMLAGIAVFVVAWWVAGRRAARTEAG